MASDPEGENMIVIKPMEYAPCQHSIIMLHDNGSNGAECRDRLFSAKIRPVQDRPRTLDKLLDCCTWVFPDAPHPASNSNKPGARQWFDTPNMRKPQDSLDQVQPDLENSINHVLAIVEEETQWYRMDDIFIGGIGQGFAVAAGAMLVDGTGDFAGLIGLRGWLPFSQQLIDEMGNSHHREWVNTARTWLAPNKFSVAPAQSCSIILRNQLEDDNNTPIFLAHPRYDKVVDHTETSRARKVFVKMGWPELELNWRPYSLESGDDQPIPGINAPNGVEDLWRWLKDRCRTRKCPKHPQYGHIYTRVKYRMLDRTWGVHPEGPGKEFEEAAKKFLG